MTDVIYDLVKLVVRWAREGLSDSEIEARLRDPSSVGADLIARVVERRERGEELLGRDPKRGG